MRNNNKPCRRWSRRNKGFSTVELVIVLAIMLVVSAVAMPNLIQIHRNYQLNDASAKMADILKRTRFDAVRRDAVVNCQLLVGFAGPNTTSVWSDVPPARGAAGPLNTSTQTLFIGQVGPVSAANVPNKGGLAAQVGAVALNALNPAANPAITFDQRGAVVAPVGVNVIYLAHNGMPTLGYRAVVVLPSGSVQLWQADSTGAWHLFD